MLAPTGAAPLGTSWTNSHALEQDYDCGFFYDANHGFLPWPHLQANDISNFGAQAANESPLYSGFGLGMSAQNMITPESSGASTGATARANPRTKTRISCPLPHCNRDFGRRSDMIRHYRSKHEGEMHPCAHCGFIGSRKDKLTAHQRAKHARR